MKQGGTSLSLETDSEGVARASLSHLDGVEDTGYAYQCVAMFNLERTDTGYKPAQTPQFLFYARSRPDPPLDRVEQ
jgi:hypothetical protein